MDIRHYDSFPVPDPPVDIEKVRAKLSRTLYLLASSSVHHRKKVKIALLGQSLVNQAWWTEFDRNIRLQYPHADIELRMLAVGGASNANQLRLLEHELFCWNPDVAVYQAAGDHYALADLVARIRSRTTTELVLMNSPAISEKAAAAAADIPDKSDLPWAELYSYKLMPAIANYYDVAMFDMRSAWAGFRGKYGIAPFAFERNPIAGHYNALGNHTERALVESLFHYDPARPCDGAEGNVFDLAVEWDDGNLKLEFTGTRIEAFAVPGPRGNAKVLIDGQPPSAFPGVFSFSRSGVQETADWPWTTWALIRIGSDAPLVEETWKIRVIETTDEPSRFRFEVEGSVTGKDGAGWSDEKFESDSGRVVIEPEDWWVPNAVRLARGRGTRPEMCDGPPQGFEIGWQVIVSACDQYRGLELFDRSRECPVTLASGLENTSHMLEMRADGDPPALSHFRVYRPELTDPKPFPREEVK